MGGNPDKVNKLREAGLTDGQIKMISDGKVPQGFNVHHKVPIDDGGTNSFDNLVLIRNEPEHYTITNIQRELTKDISYGETKVIDFPVPQGFIYPPSM